jgi:ABC-type transport system involved in cytochrome bd biosynthesis fused ATPase/permease subunit
MTSGQKKKNSIKGVLDGDMLLSPFLHRNLGLLLLIVALVIVYVSNRYAFQHEQLEIQRLRTELNDVKYEALARSRELMEKSRESNIQKYIEEQGSALQASTQHPVVIKK